MTAKVLAERYEVQRQLGKQTGRQTLLARDLQTQELVVIKQLFLGSDFEWQDLKLFEREAETLKALSHSAIPRYLDYLEIDEPDNKGFALVQTYVEGKNLEDHLRSGRTFSESEVKQLAKSLLEILIYLHEQNLPVIHRDLKPSNILLHSRSGHSVGQVYLIDFGSVQNQAAKFGGTITVVGTYGYMAPEQFGGRSVPASDLYGLGATLIYLVTGLHPTELPQQDLRIQFADRAAHLNPDVIDWLEWMTEPSLDKRLSSAEEALRSLKNPRPTDKIMALQPQCSDIKLTQTSELIKIIIPPQGVGFGLIAIFAGWIPANLKLLLEFVDGRTYPVLNLISIIWLVTVLAMFICALFRESCLRIDRQKISYTSHLLGLKWNNSMPIPRQDICQLEIEEIGDKASQMIVRAGNQKYRLGVKQGLSKSEIEWLATEVSQWLGLKIIRTLTDGKKKISM
ncbi:serine/threonine protein kinase [Tychonema sp. LEGE 07199]|uniref:serine/threonine protein kinase n=1 Tax=Microcoleaceae TaxID=1892252 RepID=UPI00187FA85E|nr:MULTISPECIES: serine/threonine-protein kinase [unclassified Tychonema]MBE9122256.1 serine/threonine protein kinase [Tychonema sp. LEGE 07199]MBE9134418.1 serine/threonine protein kinase [Tychonema sp. LEGE 07196]MBE9164881.1 serine/threonine protein kinase [Tychonema sp. LEGE 06208]